MIDGLAWLKKQVANLGDHDRFTGVLGIRAVDISEGRSALTMPIRGEVHGNIYGKAHGGALASLADTAMGLACATVGKRTVTLDMNINYVGGAAVGETVRADAKVIHSGKSTLVVECEMTSDGRLLAKARGTFFVIGQYTNGED